MPRLAWDNAAHSLLERTLDDSANRRSLLPEAFLISDEILGTAQRILDNLRVDEVAMNQNLARFSPFAGTERVLMALSKAGADRQAMHERLHVHAREAWDAMRAGFENPLVERIRKDPVFLEYVGEGDLVSLLDASRHIGDAPRRARDLADSIRQSLG
jgi:adenylosuccinate lyase